MRSGRTLVHAEAATVLAYAQYSLYFSGVLALYYLAKTALVREPDLGRPLSIGITPVNGEVLYVLYGVIAAYVVTVFAVNAPAPAVLWSDRGAASAFKLGLNARYKIQLLYAVVVTITLYLGITRNQPRYLWLLLPFVTMDLVTTDRSFLYQALVVAAVMVMATGRRLPAWRLGGAALAIDPWRCCERTGNGDRP